MKLPALLLLFLSGCSMTEQEVDAATRACQDRDMDSQFYVRSDDSVTKVTCKPKYGVESIYE